MEDKPVEEVTPKMPSIIFDIDGDNILVKVSVPQNLTEKQGIHISNAIFSITQGRINDVIVLALGRTQIPNISKVINGWEKLIIMDKEVKQDKKNKPRIGPLEVMKGS